jgi:hypothetical protein
MPFVMDRGIAAEKRKTPTKLPAPLRLWFIDGNSGGIVGRAGRFGGGRPALHLRLAAPEIFP